MKKISINLKRYISLREQRNCKKNRLKANRIKDNKYRQKNLEKIYPELYAIKKLRQDLKVSLYKRQVYKGAPLIVELEGQFGIEDSQHFDYFINKAASFIDFRNKELHLVLKKCSCLWPSGITLLCSLYQWIHLSSKVGYKPKISSYPSDNVKVNSYLGHCGFYGYVNRMLDTDENYYDEKDIVKIDHDTSRLNIEEKEGQIINLLKKYSDYSDDDIRLFDCVILTEVFNNVTEHGIPSVDAGIWVLAQYHKRHGLISICVADNGIGIKNSLLTGPQRRDILSEVSDEPKNEGYIINLTFDKNLTGSVTMLPTSDAFWKKRVIRGTKRGFGLKRIKETCKQLKLPFTILSHYGFVRVDGDGEVKYGGMEKRIFAGTLYHFNVPARKDETR